MLEPAPVRKSVVCREIYQQDAEEDDFVEVLLQKADADRLPLPLPPLVEVSDIMEVEDDPITQQIAEDCEKLEEIAQQPSSSTSIIPEQKQLSPLYTEEHLKEDIEKLNITRNTFEKIWQWFDSQEEPDDRAQEDLSQAEEPTSKKAKNADRDEQNLAKSPFDSAAQSAISSQVS